MPIDERALAEQALATLLTRDASLEPQWPAVADRLRSAREAMGLEGARVAERIGVTPGTYYDAEGRDDGTFTCLSIAEIARLSEVLSVSPGELLFGASRPVRQEVTFGELVTRLRVSLAASGLGIEEFGEKIGWELSGVLGSPDALWDFNIVGFRDVCRAVDVDWVAALPDKDSDPPPVNR